MKNVLLTLTLIFSSFLIISCGSDDEMPVIPDPDPDPDTMMVEEDPDVLDLPAAGLIAYYDFNENVDDQSGNDHHGIVNGGSFVPDRNGAEDGAYKFELGDYIEIAHDPIFNFNGLNPYSIGIFVKYIQHPDIAGISTTRLISKFNGGVNSSWYLGISGNKEMRSYRNVDPFAMDTELVTEDEYHHLVVTFDGMMQRHWIDGEMVSEENWSSQTNNGNTAILLGASYDNDIVKAIFVGEMDDVVIYDRALTATEIKNMWED